MADPPVTQEAGQLPEKQSNVSAKLSICFGRHPDTKEIYCTTQGANSRRLLQARQEHSLNVVHRPQPEHPHRPQDLFDIMPLPTRRLNMSSTYFLNKSKTKRIHVSVVTTSEFRLLPKPEVHAMSPNPKRAHFNIGDPDLDIPTIRFLQSAIDNICERCKYQQSCAAIQIFPLTQPQLTPPIQCQAIYCWASWMKDSRPLSSTPRADTPHRPHDCPLYS
jgi:hypothetical protein